MEQRQFEASILISERRNEGCNGDVSSYHCSSDSCDDMMLVSEKIRQRVDDGSGHGCIRF